MHDNMQEPQLTECRLFTVIKFILSVKCILWFKNLLFCFKSVFIY